MDKKIFIGVVVSLVIALVFPMFVMAQKAEDPKKFEEYRAAIKKSYGIDIKNFKDGIKGGKADGKPITKYDLQQLLMGIEVELEHTNNKMRALEISMDHLEEFPDYYTRLEKMEKEAEAYWKEKK
ncbi:MAG: hypothetical protein N2745_08665 [Syntrophorhabdaceae bacterium]|nr:hypothetical protein [Syntrophorhabdaceae bacterium]